MAARLSSPGGCASGTATGIAATTRTVCAGALSAALRATELVGVRSTWWMMSSAAFARASLWRRGSRAAAVSKVRPRRRVSFFGIIGSAFAGRHQGVFTSISPFTTQGLIRAQPIHLVITLGLMYPLKWTYGHHPCGSVRRANFEMTQCSTSQLRLCCLSGSLKNEA